MTNPARYRSLDIWRGVACLAIVGFHATAYRSHSPFGVPKIFRAAELLRHGVTIFFVMSGYCITASMLGHQAKSSAWSTYALRRVRRIFPPYWSALTLAAVVVVGASAIGIGHLWTEAIYNIGSNSAVPHPATLNGWQWLGNLTLTEAWRGDIAGGGGPRYFLGIAWTLCYEEQFYAIAGLLMVLAMGSPIRVIVGAWFVSACTLISMATGLTVPGLFFDGTWHYLVTKPISAAAEAAGLADWQVWTIVVPLSFAGSLLLAWGFFEIIERRFLPGSSPANPQGSTPLRDGVHGAR